MLSWWALIPTALFVLVQLTMGWAQAETRATSPEYALSYIIGRIMGGILISALIGWIVYRVAGRSQLGGTIAYSCMILLSCAGAVKFELTPPPRGPATNPPAGASAPTAQPLAP